MSTSWRPSCGSTSAPSAIASDRCRRGSPLRSAAEWNGQNYAIRDRTLVDVVPTAGGPVEHLPCPRIERGELEPHGLSGFRAVGLGAPVADRKSTRLNSSH